MDIKYFKGKKITVMGLGLHGGGIGTIRFLSQAGAKLIVTDLKSKEELAASLGKLKEFKDIEYVLGQHRMEDFSNVDMVIKSPPIRWDNVYIKEALNKKIPVEMDSSLFFKLCKNPIVGVTGTRGKTTTATLIHSMLKLAGKEPIMAGIGQVSVLDKLKELKDDSTIVFELSSWRLSALGRSGISPKVAVFTNLFQDHLNYYRSMKEYLEDKKNIYKNQKKDDFCVINADDETVSSLEAEIKSQLIRFSSHRISGGKAAYLSDDSIFLNDGTSEKVIMPVSEIRIKGPHNIGNVLASVGAAYAMGVNIEVMAKAVKEFHGLPHRLEFVRELEGVSYYNDTAATSPDGAISGINSFSEPVVLICGGSEKNLDMSGLGKVIAEKVKKVVLLKGDATGKIRTSIRNNLAEGKEMEILEVGSMDQAVRVARGIAEKGDVVLLSPGTASFGMFLNEFDRGDRFKEAVRGLSQA